MKPLYLLNQIKVVHSESILEMKLPDFPAEKSSIARPLSLPWETQPWVDR